MTGQTWSIELNYSEMLELENVARLHGELHFRAATTICINLAYRCDFIVNVWMVNWEKFRTDQSSSETMSGLGQRLSFFLASKSGQELLLVQGQL